MDLVIWDGLKRYFFARRARGGVGKPVFRVAHWGLEAHARSGSV